jgi:hypothetical protein
MASVNGRWQSMMTAGFVSSEAAGELYFLLRCNVVVVVAGALRGAYRHQLAIIFNRMMDVYLAYSGQLTTLVQGYGEMASRYSGVVAMKAVKSWVIRVLINYVTKTPNSIRDPDGIFPRVLTDIIEEYSISLPDARVPMY